MCGWIDDWTHPSVALPTVFSSQREAYHCPHPSVKVLQDRESMRTYTERVREGIVELEARYGNDT